MNDLAQALIQQVQNTITETQVQLDFALEKGLSSTITRLQAELVKANGVLAVLQPLVSPETDQE